MTELLFYLRVAALAPQFASNPYLTTFLVGLALWLDKIPGPKDSWLAQPGTLIVLAVLILAELYFVQLDPGLRDLWHEIDNYVKAGAHILVTHSLVDPESAFVLNMAVGYISPLMMIWSFMTSAGVWLVSSIRKQFYWLLGDMDQDDDLGIQMVSILFESTWVLVVGWLALVMPVVALVLSGFIVLTIYLVEKHLERREAEQRIPCSACAERIHPTALDCPACHTANNQTRAINLIGISQSVLVVDRDAHRMKLLALKRCPTCAARLREKTLKQSCPECRRDTFPTADALHQYLDHVSQPLGNTMLVSFLFGLIPFVGFIPGIIYYRLSLIASLRRYLPRGAGIVSRWGVRLLNLTLISLQWIPFLGAFLLPVMCYTNYYVYRKVLEHEGRRIFTERRLIESAERLPR